MSLAIASARRTRIELLRFRRTHEQVVFSFALPIVLMTLLASILGGGIGNTGVDFSQYIVAGMVASVALNVGVNDLAPQLALDRSDGTIKRLGGTPMPPAAYVLGKLGSVVVTAVLQTALLLAIGVALFDVELPSATGWVTFSWVFLLGLTSAVLLGMAISTIVTDPRSASAVVSLPFVVLQFISGIWFQFGDLPTGLQHIASLFPLRWMALGMRSVFLPESFAVNEPGGSWQLGMVALVLAIWTIAGLALVLGRFRLRTER
jgi:ABC-2 type transport system permease protein